LNLAFDFKQKEIEILKKTVSALGTVDATTFNISPSPSSSLSSSSFSNYSKTSSFNSSNATTNSKIDENQTSAREIADPVRKPKTNALSALTTKLKTLLFEKPKRSQKNNLKIVNVNEIPGNLRTLPETKYNQPHNAMTCSQTDREQLNYIKSNLEKKLQ
jgi:hypothetical protein